MDLITHNINSNKIAEIISDEIIINNLQDSLDLIGDVSYRGMSKIIVKETNLSPEFFELRSGLAGEILQKCVNYHIKMAFIGNFENVASTSLRAFILECNRGNQFFFVPDLQSALEMLGKN